MNSMTNAASPNGARPSLPRRPQRSPIATLGPSSADAERAVSSATVNVQVAVESPGRKAAPLKLPPLRTESRMMYCVAYASASGALVLAVLYLFGLVYFRVQENSGLPPPFFKYSAGFRGW